MSLRKKTPLLLFLLAASSPFLLVSQDVGELEKRNGFKDLRLGMFVDSIRGVELKKELKEKNEFPVQLYAFEDEAYQGIGEVKIKKIELKAYKGLVYEIVVITEKDTRLMKGMIKTFGEPKYILTSDTYNWVAPSLSLTFKDHSKKQIKLTYRYYPVLKMMLEDKGKKIDAIAEDF